MTRFRTEVAQIHRFLKLPFAALCTSDGVDLTIHQIFEQTRFKMGHNTIG